MDEEDQMDSRDVRIGLLEVARAIMMSADRIAKAIDRHTEATMLLARATAGEFDQDDEPASGQSLSDTSGGRGMGMG